MLPLSIEIRTKGLEPSRSYPLEPETSASTNSATCAFIGARGLNHNFTRQASKICKKWHFSFLREKPPLSSCLVVRMPACVWEKKRSTPGMVMKKLAKWAHAPYNNHAMSHPLAAENGADSRAVKPVREQKRRMMGVRPEIPDHEILRSIGMGAYGEVWLARSVTGAYRAVKVVWRDDFDDERSFVREFEGVLNYEPIARGIPGLVHILHVGKHDTPSPCFFYVMELADDAYTGIHIEPSEYVPRTLLRDMQLYGHRPMPLDFVIEVGCQLARALAGLHAEELTHRDVKPSNVVFVNGRAKLADAGLVAHSSQRSFVGTEGYIPPDGPGTPRADVYALAKVLYELGTGKDRLDFPELPADIPEGATHRRWQQFNNLICAAAEPHITKDTIISAQHFAEQLESLRDDYLHPKRKVAKPRGQQPGGRRFSRRLPLLLTLALLLALASHFVPSAWRERVFLAVHVLLGDDTVPAGASSAQETLASTAAPAGPPSSTGNQAPPAFFSMPRTNWLAGAWQQAEAVSPSTQPTRDIADNSGQLFIGSYPSGASIYTQDGHYVDETPFGPVRMEQGQEVTFILRKEGYADSKLSGIVPTNGVLTLSGDLIPYRPPRQGQVWKDALGTRYRPDAYTGTHRADSPVTREMFEQFLRDQHLEDVVRYQLVPETDIVRTTQKDIGAFTLWLTHACEKQGTIGRDHSLIANPEPRTGTRDGLCGYRLSVVQVQKTPITIYTNPAGATVMLNGNVLGVTPMLDMRIPLAPYFLEVRMPGYSTVRRSGLSPQNLFLNLDLQPNNSVVFGSEWINSLGMKFQPAGSGMLAGATEVRVSDYKAFCRDSGHETPPEPRFTQNEHHPVVNVSREDAEAFAHWLTITERDKGYIEDTDVYRLPTDEEWSALAGLRNEEGRSPYERHLNSSSQPAPEFPWGIKWPPTRATGNFADLSALPFRSGNQVIPGYRDDFPHTAPVASFASNMLGLHDIDGNVSEWVSGDYGGPAGFSYRHYGVTRGGDFNSFRPSQLYSSTRSPHLPTERMDTVGFRLMLERYPRARAASPEL